MSVYIAQSSSYSRIYTVDVARSLSRLLLDQKLSLKRTQLDRELTLTVGMIQLSRELPVIVYIV